MLISLQNFSNEILSFLRGSCATNKSESSRCPCNLRWSETFSAETVDLLNRLVLRVINSWLLPSFPECLIFNNDKPLLSIEFVKVLWKINLSVITIFPLGLKLESSKIIRILNLNTYFVVLNDVLILNRLAFLSWVKYYHIFGCPFWILSSCRHLWGFFRLSPK